MHSNTQERRPVAHGVPPTNPDSMQPDHSADARPVDNSAAVLIAARRRFEQKLEDARLRSQIEDVFS